MNESSQERSPRKEEMEAEDGNRLRPESLERRTRPASHEEGFEEGVSLTQRMLFKAEEDKFRCNLVSKYASCTSNEESGRSTSRRYKFTGKTPFLPLISDLSQRSGSVEDKNSRLKQGHSTLDSIKQQSQRKGIASEIFRTEEEGKMGTFAEDDSVNLVRLLEESHQRQQILLEEKYKRQLKDAEDEFQKRWQDLHQKLGETEALWKCRFKDLETILNEEHGQVLRKVQQEADSKLEEERARHVEELRIAKEEAGKELRKELDLKEEDLRSMAKELQEKIWEAEAVGKKNKELEDAVQKSSETIESLRTDLNNMHNNGSDLQSHISNLENQLEGSSNVIADKEHELVELATYCKSLQNELLTLRPLSRTLKTLSQENERLLSSLQLAEEEASKSRREGRWQEMEREEELIRLREEMRVLKREKEKLEEKNGGLMSRLAQAYAEAERSDTYRRNK